MSNVGSLQQERIVNTETMEGERELGGWRERARWLHGGRELGGWRERARWLEGES